MYVYTDSTTTFNAQQIMARAGKICFYFWLCTRSCYEDKQNVLNLQIVTSELP